MKLLFPCAADAEGVMMSECFLCAIAAEGSVMSEYFLCASAVEGVMMSEWLPFFILAIGAWQDQKDRKISVWCVALLAAAGMVFHMIHRDISLWILMDLLPGGMLYFLSFAVRGEIGAGDGLILAALGLSRGCLRTAAEAFLALVLFTLWGVIQVLRRKRTMRTPSAYLPYLLIADGIFLLCK